MWRFLLGIPRAIRQQIQSNIRQRPSCIDDEYKARAPCDQVVYHPACGITVTRRYSSSNGGYKKEHDEQGPDREQYEWRKPIFDFWNQVQYGRHSAVEALGWGTGVVLGIHLSKLSSGEACEGKRACCRLLYKIAHTSPLVNKPVSQKNVLPPNSKSTAEEKLQTDQTQGAAEGPNALDLVFTEFEDLCRVYSATGNNIAGLQHAAQHNMKEAVHHWKEASKLGCAKAQFNLGLCYESGIGVKTNLPEAVKQYSLAGASDHAEAVYNLALLYLNGGPGVEQDIDQALSLMGKAAELGLAQAQTYLGVYYTREENEDMVKAVSWFKAAAAQKDPEAQYFLGICYEEGWGIEQNECKAGELYRQASSAGHDGAMYNLAVFHEYGLGGLPMNVDAALELYEKSAKLGNEHAQHSMDRLKATDVTAEWQRQEFAQQMTEVSLKEPRAYLRSPASSPSLTEFVRGHLQELTIEPAQTADEPAWVSFQGLTLEEPCGAQGTFTLPKFYLGEPDESGVNIDYKDAGQVQHNTLYSVHTHMVRPASLYDLRVACT